MDVRLNCLTVALNTIKSVDLITPCEPEDLCAALNDPLLSQGARFPNIVEPRPMSGRLTGICDRDEQGIYRLVFDSLGTREQQQRDLCHEIGHMVAMHALTGLRCQRGACLTDIREREAEMIADWLIVLLSLPDLSRYDASDFRLLLERINHPKKRWWRGPR